MEPSTKLWGGEGRFSCGLNVNLSQLNNSLSIDKRLFAEDIRGSLAYAEVLTDAKIIKHDELLKIKAGFDVILHEWNSGKIVIREDDEDIHSLNERRLIEIIGDVGRKIHTGRSRNDQVAVDMKLWMKSAITEVLENMKQLLNVVVKKAEDKIDVIMPGYTHLQVTPADFLRTFSLNSFLASTTRQI